ncbi:hypothetical protein [Nostoc sp.]|uniref:hypothetical protein n=1 Tax=Nostoc sp. TaxID=1180 RepID=UPI002FF5FAB0
MAQLLQELRSGFPQGGTQTKKEEAKKIWRSLTKKWYKSLTTRAIASWIKALINSSK